MKHCGAIATSSGQRCKKRALPRSSYCLFHIEKTPLVASSLIGALVGLLLTQTCHWLVPSRELVALRAEEVQRRQAHQEVTAQLGEVQAQLEPFLDLARDMYPALDASQALVRLSSDISEVRELASRDIPAEPCPGVVKNTISALTEWRDTHPDWQVRIHLLNAGNKNATFVEAKLTQLLKRAGIRVSTPIRNHETVIVGRRSYPLTIKVAPGSTMVARQFQDTLSTYLTGETRVEEDAKVPSDVVEIGLNGEPSFRHGGTVLLD